MEEIFKVILKSLGASDEILTKIENALKEEATKKTFNTKDVIDGIVAHQKRLLENDNDFISKFQSAEKGKFMEQIDRRLKQSFGLTNDDLKDKTIEEKITLAKTTLEGTYSKNGNDLQNENIALKNQIKKFEEEEIPKIKGEILNFKKSFKIDNAIAKIVGENKLRISPEAILPAIKSALESAYHIDMNDSDVLEILTKDTKLQIKNADSTAILTPKDIIVSKLKEFKAIEESNADDEKTRQTIIVKKEGEKTGVEAQSLSLAEQNLLNAKKIPATKV